MFIYLYTVCILLLNIYSCKKQIHVDESVLQIVEMADSFRCYLGSMVVGLSAILCMETNPNQPPLACLLGFSGITSLVIMVWLKATAAGLGLGQLQLFAIWGSCSCH